MPLPPAPHSPPAHHASHPLAHPLVMAPPPPFAYAQQMPSPFPHLGFVAAAPAPTYVAPAPAYLPPYAYAAYATRAPLQQVYDVHALRVGTPTGAPPVTTAHIAPSDPDAARKVKGPWRKEEDALLTALVARYGARRWTAIAAHIPGRTGKQARERWLNQLSPDLAKRAWSPDEDRVVMDAHARLGNRWSEIAKLLKGRTDNAVKNRFNTTIRRQIAELAHHARRALPLPASPTSSSASEASAQRKRPRGSDGGGAPATPPSQRVKVAAISA